MSAQGQNTPPAMNVVVRGLLNAGSSGGHEIGTTPPARSVQSTPARARSGRW